MKRVRGRAAMKKYSNFEDLTVGSVTTMLSLSRYRTSEKDELAIASPF
jgi:hypothetical protein